MTLLIFDHTVNCSNHKVIAIIVLQNILVCGLKIPPPATEAVCQFWQTEVL